MGIRDMREWADALEPYELFSLDEVQDVFPAMSRTAVIAGLGRLCEGDDPPMCRPARGWYCRRIQNAPYPAPVPPMVYPHLGWRIAGPGAGMAGPYVANRIHWSTQVPPRIWIAVVGRPPRTPVPIVFVGRSNRRRVRADNVGGVAARSHKGLRHLGRRSHGPKRSTRHARLPVPRLDRPHPLQSCLSK